MKLLDVKNNELTLMAVHAHPDDESISTGGILAKYSAIGIRTVLVYGTRGEAGDILNPEFVPPKPGLNIKEIRAIELEAAIKVLAVASVYFLGYRDSGMAGSPENHKSHAFGADYKASAAARHHYLQSKRNISSPRPYNGEQGYIERLSGIRRHPLPGRGSTRTMAAGQALLHGNTSGKNSQNV